MRSCAASTVDSVQATDLHSNIFVASTMSRNFKPGYSRSVWIRIFFPPSYYSTIDTTVAKIFSNKK